MICLDGTINYLLSRTLPSITRDEPYFYRFDGGNGNHFKATGLQYAQ